MTNGFKRDLHADLALCEAAVTSEDYYVEDREDEVVIVGDGGREIAEFYTLTDAEFYCESREGWPEAVRRAIAAEAEVEQLTAFIESESECATDLVAENERLREAERWLKALVSAIDDGRIAKAKMSSGTDYVILCAREYVCKIGPQEVISGEEEVEKMRAALGQIAEYGGTDMRGATCAGIAKEALGYATR